MNDLLSIIIPVYNAERVLERCLDSIIAQTYDNFECLLINDGSTDNSLFICEQFAEKDSRIKVYTQENKGVSSARNFGLKIAKGNWITFVDSDDYLSPIMYENLIKKSNKNSVDVLICAYKYVFGNIEKELVRSGVEKYINSHKSINFLKGKSWIGGGPWNKIFRKELLVNLFFDESISFGEDTLFIIAALLRARSIFVTSAAYYYYVQNENSLSHTYNYSIVRYAYKLLDLYKNDSFMKRYSKATICYIEYFYSEKNNIRNKHIPYKTSFFISMGFPLKTKVGFMMYLFVPFIYKVVRN